MVRSCLVTVVAGAEARPDDPGVERRGGVEADEQAQGGVGEQGAQGGGQVPWLVVPDGPDVPRPGVAVVVEAGPAALDERPQCERLDAYRVAFEGADGAHGAVGVDEPLHGARVGREEDGEALEAVLAGGDGLGGGELVEGGAGHAVSDLVAGAAERLDDLGLGDAAVELPAYAALLLGEGGAGDGCGAAEKLAQVLALAGGVDGGDGDAELEELVEEEVTEGPAGLGDGGREGRVVQLVAGANPGPVGRDDDVCAGRAGVPDEGLHAVEQLDDVGVRASVEIVDEEDDGFARPPQEPAEVAGDLEHGVGVVLLEQAGAPGGVPEQEPAGDKGTGPEDADGGEHAGDRGGGVLEAFEGGGGEQPDPADERDEQGKGEEEGRADPPQPGGRIGGPQPEPRRPPVPCSHGLAEGGQERPPGGADARRSPGVEGDGDEVVAQLGAEEVEQGALAGAPRPVDVDEEGGVRLLVVHLP